MAAPKNAINRFDLSMSYSEFNFIMNRRKYIGLKILPPIGVAQEAASFARLNVGSYMKKPEDTARAPRSGYNRDTFTWDQDEYATQEHGVEEVCDDAEEELYGDVIRGEMLATARTADRVLARLEQDISDLVSGPTALATWNTADLTTAAGAVWSDKAAADPIADIDAAREKVKVSCGMRPNTLQLTDTDFINCIRTDRIEGLLRYDLGQIMLALNGQAGYHVVEYVATGLAALFQVEMVYIGQSFMRVTNDGADHEFGRFWTPGRAMLCHVNNDGMQGDLRAAVPNIGRTIWTNKNNEPMPGMEDGGYGSLLFDEYREEQTRGSVFRARNKRQVKLMHKEAGHLITGLV